jgi:juvenile hormone acid methyltransferase
MNDTVLYSSNNASQRTDTVYALTVCANLLKWKNNEDVLDVGTGDGGVTSDILLPRLPEDLKKLVCLDVSEKMVEFTRGTLKHNSKAEFVQMDIATKEIPSELFERFDHIFSFNCLHWVPRDKHLQALKNMHKMLKPGGQLLVTIISTAAMFDIYENMARDKKWSPFLTNVQDYISMYHESEDPPGKLESYLTQVGFVTHLCQQEDRVHTYSGLSSFWSWAKAINPFVRNLQNNLQESYFQDYFKELRKHDKVMFEVENDQEKVHLFYSFLVACASKSSVEDSKLQKCPFSGVGRDVLSTSSD